MQNISINSITTTEGEREGERDGLLALNEDLRCDFLWFQNKWYF